MSNIVIYEDDGPMRALLKEWLGEAGYAVRAAAEPVRLPAEDADLVIVSVYMPKHAGMQRVRDVRASHSQAPLIAISSQFRSGLSTAGATAQLLGVDQVIAKPLARENLLDAVRDIIGPAS
jgi:DNA-binding response OmpR family regulator